MNRGEPPPPSPYSERALERVRGGGKEAIERFLRALPPAAMRSLSMHLPVPRGFRRNTDKCEHQQRTLLAQRLTSDSRDKLFRDGDLEALAIAMKGWARGQFPEDTSVEEALTAAFDSLIPTGDDAPPVLEPTTSLFTLLHDLTHANKCRRSDLERLYSLGPFPESEEVDRLIGSSRSDEEVQAQHVLNEIPDHIKSMEASLRDLSANLNAHVRASKAEATVFLDMFSDLGTAKEKEQAEAKQELEALSRKVSTQLGEIRQTSVSKSEVDAKLKRAVADASTIIQESFRRTHAELVDRLAKVEALQSEMAREQPPRKATADDLAPARAPADESGIEASALEARFATREQLAAELAAFEKRFATNERHTKDLSEIERRLASIEVSKRTAEPASTLALQGHLSARQLPAAAAEPRIASDVTGIVAAIKGNLQAVGFNASSSETLAPEILAALLSEQVVFLRGGTSTAAATAVALAVAGRNSWKISIPVGLMDGAGLERCLADTVERSPGGLGAVVLLGANRSALDAYGDVLVERSLPSGSQRGRLALLATLTDGPSSLPTSSAHSALGPIFDMNALDLKNSNPTQVLESGSVSLAAWSELQQVVGHAPADAEQAAQLAGLMSPPDPMLRRTFVAALKALTAIRSSKQGPSPLQSLRFGWAVPLWIAQEATRADVKEHLDGGEDGPNVDRRIARLLEQGAFQSPTSSVS